MRHILPLMLATVSSALSVVAIAQDAEWLAVIAFPLAFVAVLMAAVNLRDAR